MSKLIVCIGALGSQYSTAIEIEEFGDFPDAHTIKSTRGEESREQKSVKIEYPPGFKFSYDELRKRWGYLPTHETTDDGKLPNTENKDGPHE